MVRPTNSLVPSREAASAGAAGSATVAEQALVDEDAAGLGRRAGGSRPRWWSELALLGSVYFLYCIIRNAVPSHITTALDNARDILGAEQLVGIDIEHRLNRLVASLQVIAVPANYFYATLHFVVTLAVLVWLYVARPRFYRRARSVLVGMTVLGLAGYWLYPLAPPRLMPDEGFVDTVHAFGIWGLAPSEVVASASNQYAAMPSMHVGWALWASAALILYAKRPHVRLLGAAYPFLTLLVVIVTANHFVLDAAGAVVVFAVAIGFVAVTTRDAPGVELAPAAGAPTQRAATELELTPMVETGQPELGRAGALMSSRTGIPFRAG
jgi:uncharacterized membrane protein